MQISTREDLLSLIVIKVRVQMTVVNSICDNV